MKNIPKLIILILMNILFILPFFAIMNLFYPIFKLLFGKFKLFYIKNINDAHQENINKTINFYADKFNIQKENKIQFNELVRKFAKYEKAYCLDIKNDQYCYYHLRYIFRIIELAQSANYALSQVNKDNKKIAFYENTKNSSIDDLIKEYIKDLQAQDHKKLYLKTSIRETKLKKLFIRMKKENSSLFFNFYLTIFTLYNLEDTKINRKDEDAFELVKSIFNFLSVGHATPNQINKSVAIQVYYFYKTIIKKSELEDMIGELIDLCLHTDLPYKNFNNIDQEPYIKNLVDKFPIFQCDNDLAFKQHQKVKRYFVYKKLFLPSFFPPFLKKFIVNKFITKPIQYYQKNALITFFGFVSAKV